MFRGHSAENIRDNFIIKMVSLPKYDYMFVRKRKRKCSNQTDDFRLLTSTLNCFTVYLHYL